MHFASGCVVSVYLYTFVNHATCPVWEAHSCKPFLLSCLCKLHNDSSLIPQNSNEISRIVPCSYGVENICRRQRMLNREGISHYLKFNGIGLRKIHFVRIINSILPHSEIHKWNRCCVATDLVISVQLHSFIERTLKFYNVLL